MANENFRVKNGLEVGGALVVNSSGAIVGDINSTTVTVVTLVANGTSGGVGDVLFSNGTVSYWSPSGALTTNVNDSYAWTNTHTFSNTVKLESNVTFGNTTVNWTANSTTANIGDVSANTLGIAIGANVVINTSAIFIGNSTVNTTIKAGNIALQGTQLTVGNVTITDSQISIGNSTVNTVLTATSIDFDGTIAAGNTTITGDLTVSGNVFFNGTTTNVNSTNLVVEDKNIILGDVDTPSDVTADGGGITLKGATDKTITWVDSTDAWTASEDFNLVSGKQYEINGTQVINSTALGTGITGSSLTSVGTLTGLAVDGTVTVGNSTVNTVINSTAVALKSLVANGTIGAAGDLLFSNGTVAYWAPSGDVSVNVNAQYAWTNTHSFSNTITFGNSTVNTIVNSTSVTTTNLAGNGASVTSVDAATVGGNTASTLRTYSETKAGEAYTNATSFASNADNISSGTLNTARLPATIEVSTLVSVGNSTVNSFINSTSVSATNLAGNGALITSVDAASVGGNTASTLRTYSETKAGEAYSNATSYASNADNISSGTLNTARLPATVNVSSAINVGANVNLTTSDITIGNSTVNTAINSTAVALKSLVANGSVGGAGDLLFSNGTVAYWAPSGAVSVNLNATYAWTNNHTFAANVTVNNVFTVGNSTVNTVVNSTSVSATNLSGNGASVTSVDAATVGGNTASTLRTYSETKAGEAYSNATTYASNADNISSGTLNTARLPATIDIATAIKVGNSTVNSSVNSSVVSTTNVVATNLSGNGASITSVDAATVGGNTASTLRTYSETKAGEAYSNAISYSGNAAQAYSNATAFASNADNISSGTLNTARLPATVNVTSVLNVGANVSLNTSAVFVGNSTVNAVLTSTSLDVDGVVNIGNTTITGDLVVSGNVFFNGTTTNVNSTNLVVEDKNIVIGDVASPSDVTADGGGITLKGATDKTLNWVDSSDSWTSSENLDLASGKEYKINNVQVINSSSLGSGITGSSLTSVGTLNGLSVTGTANASVAINVGANVNLSTSSINVGNSTVNTSINSSAVALKTLIANGAVGAAGDVLFSNGTVSYWAPSSALTTNVDAAYSWTNNHTFAANVTVNNVFTVGNSTVNTVINSTSISTTNLAGNGASVTSVDAATVGGNTASTLRTYSETKAGEAYSNATTYASNADNISSGTLNTARLPATVNVSTAVNVGANVNLTTSSINIGNSTVNTTVNSSVVSTTNVVATNLSGNGASITSVDAATLGGNTASTLRTYSETKASEAYSNATSYADTKAGQAYTNATSFASNADNISSGTLNTARLPATVNVSTAVNVGANVNLSTSSINVGNSTVNTAINSTAVALKTLIANGTVGAAGDVLFSNGTVSYWSPSAALTTNVDASYSWTNNHTFAANVTVNNVFTVGNSTVNTVVNSTAVTATKLSGNGATITSVDAVTVGGNTASTLRTYSETKAGEAYSNATTYSSNADNISSGTLNTARLPATIQVATAVSVGNSTVNSVVNSSVVTTTNVVATNLSGNGASVTSVDAATVGGNTAATLRSYTDTKAAEAYSNAVNASGSAAQAYTNAVAYASNADNISSGTLNTARLPATVNLATALNVGADVSVNTSALLIGNSTVNTVISVGGITTNALTVSANIVMGGNRVTGLGEPLSANDAATKAYVDDVAQGLHTHDTCNAATTGTLATLSSGTVTYDNGTNGVGAKLTTTGSYTTIDGVTLSNGSRILVKNEANAAHNGIYERSNTTVLTRATDFDAPAEMAGGDFTFVTGGSTYDSTGWVMSDAVTTVGTSTVTWVQFSGAGTYTATGYLFLNGTVFAANANTQAQASVLVARDSNGGIAANGVSAVSATFAGPVSGVTTLGAGNTTITGFANVSGNVYVGNSTVFWTANSTEIDVGNATINTTVIAVGANVNLTTSSITVGNSTVNSFVNSTAIAIKSVFANGGIGAAGDLLFSNGTGAYWAPSGTVAVNVNAQYAWTNTHSFSNTITFGNSTVNVVVNSTSVTIASGVVANTSGSYPTSNTVATALGSTTQRWILNANTINASGLITGTAGLDITGTANVSSILNVGANVSVNTSTLFIGNSTVNTVISAGNIALNGSQLTVGNTTISTTLTGDILSIGNSTVNTAINSSSISVAKLIANGASATADQILYANSTGGVYWRTPATITNVEPSNVGATSNGHVWYVYV